MSRNPRKAKSCCSESVVVLFLRYFLLCTDSQTITSNNYFLWKQCHVLLTHHETSWKMQQKHCFLSSSLSEAAVGEGTWEAADSGGTYDGMYQSAGLEQLDSTRLKLRGGHQIAMKNLKQAGADLWSFHARKGLVHAEGSCGACSGSRKNHLPSRQQW